MRRRTPIFPSPYGLGDTMLLPLHYCRPSTRGAGQHRLAPLSGGDPGRDGVLRLVFLGDLMADHNWQLPDVSPRFGELVQGADLVVANAEGPVAPGDTPDRRGPYGRVRFSAAYLGRLLERLGIDPARCLLSVANNHAGDRGRAGLEGTVEALGRLGIRTVGVRDAHSPLVRVDLGPLTMGFVAWTELQNRSDPETRGGTCGPGDIDGHGWIEEARRSGVDCLAALPHWGVEFQHFPRPGVRARAASLASAGVRIIAGHHPHVVQPLERSEGGLCLYSGGNVVGPAIPLAWPCRLFVALEVALTADGTAVGEVAGYRVHPFAQLRERGRTRIVGLGELCGRRAGRFRRRLGMLFKLDEP